MAKTNKLFLVSSFFLLFYSIFIIALDEPEPPAIPDTSSIPQINKDVHEGGFSEQQPENNQPFVGGSSRRIINTTNITNATNNKSLNITNGSNNSGNKTWFNKKNFGPAIKQDKESKIDNSIQEGLSKDNEEKIQEAGQNNPLIPDFVENETKEEKLSSKTYPIYIYPSIILIIVFASLFIYKVRKRNKVQNLKEQNQNM